MNIYHMVANANHSSRFRPTDEKMIAEDIKNLGGEGRKITYRSITGGVIVEVWKHGSIERRIQRRR